MVMYQRADARIEGTSVHTILNSANSSKFNGNNVTTNTNVDFSRVTGFHSGVTALTELNILLESGGTFSGGSYKLYGVK